jgi:hypothetical protein
MKYNEFTAKKLGEVLAFCQVGLDTIDKGETALTDAYKDFDISPAELRKSLLAHAGKIEAFVNEAGVSEITNAKAQKTGEKLTLMRDMYVGEEWDNPAELMEWSGFFEGAAVVHFALVVGVAEVLADTELKKLADEGLTFHHNLLHTTQKAITAIGKNKAK